MPDIRQHPRATIRTVGIVSILKTTVSMTQAKHFSHLPQLDGIRAIAVGMVFVAHAGFERIVPGGFGVTIFFFLSGYLITSLLVAEASRDGSVSLTQFYLRRTLRIWPALWITMAFCALAIHFGWLDFAVDGWGVVAQLAFVINYAFLWGHPDGLPYLALWSLAVEEHFYLIFPLVFSVILIGLRPSKRLMFCVAGCVVILLIRILSVALLDDYQGIYYWSHTRIDSILFGCCLAVWRNPALDDDFWRPRPWQIGAAIVVLLVCFAIRNEAFRQTVRYSLQGVALYVLFAHVLVDRGWLHRILMSRGMVLIGLYSYTIYLVHYVFIGIVYSRFPQVPLWLRITIVAVLSIGYAKLMYDFVEHPLARLRKSFQRVQLA